MFSDASEMFFDVSEMFFDVSEMFSVRTKKEFNSVLINKVKTIK
jgi:hypothetical protein